MSGDDVFRVSQRSPSAALQQQKCQERLGIRPSATYDSVVVRSAGLAKRSKDQSRLFGQVAHRARQLDLHHSTEEEDEISVPIQAFTYSLS